MKLEYDKDVDAAYIYFQYPLKEGQVKNTVELNRNIVLDCDTKGKILGIEILDASKVLAKNVLANVKSH